MLINFIVVIFSLCMCISNHHAIHFNSIQFFYGTFYKLLCHFCPMNMLSYTAKGGIKVINQLPVK